MSYIELKEVDSTNDYIKQNIDKLSNLTTVRADFQTKGKGRNGHLWDSLGGENLLMSILITDFKKTEDLHKITQLAACSVAGLLDRYNIKAKIKWPNDIYVGDQKICGILVEAVYQDELKGVIVGIGLNVNALDNYVSMKQLTGKTYSLKALMISMLTYFKIYYNLYQHGEYYKVLDYANEIAYLKDKQVTYLDYGLVTFTHLNDDGTVDFVDAKGKKHQVIVNEISLAQK